MRIAERTDWKTLELPERRTTIALDRRFSADEMERLRRGFIPEEMEDKWFIFLEDDRLYFHRSWTGICIYVVRLVPDGDGRRMVEAEVNREPTQYTQTDDEQDAATIGSLIDLFLLGQPSIPPTGHTDPGKRALALWSLVGRAPFNVAGTGPPDDHSRRQEGRDGKNPEEKPADPPVQQELPFDSVPPAGDTREKSESPRPRQPGDGRKPES